MKYKLFDKYKYNHLSDFMIGDGGKIKYYIPPEYVINPIETNSIRITPNIIESGFDNWISNRYIGKYLPLSTEYNLQEWYDIIELHLPCSELRPKCSVCGKELPFSGRLTWGYRMDNRFKGDTNRRFCSRECRSSAGLAGWRLQWSSDYDKMREIVKDSSRMSHQNILGYNAELDKQFLLKTQCHYDFLGSIYVVSTVDKFKIGYSKWEEPKERIRKCIVDRFGGEFDSIYVFRGDWIYMIHLEYNLKLQFFYDRVLDQGFETFHRTPEYDNLIRSLLSNAKLKLTYYLTSSK